MNKWIGTGRLTKDPETRTAKNDTTICNFTIACPRRGKDAGADFISCVAFNKTAEWIQKYFTKGKMIAVDGHIQTRSWSDDSGVKHYSTEIIVDNAEFCGAKEDGGSAPSNNSGEQSTQATASEPDAGSDPGEEDLPF